MDLERALSQWGEDLGGGRVLADAAAVDRYARTTLAAAPRPAAVVRASSTEDVVSIVRTARDCDVPLYPISRGNNWGFGDACPAGDGQVVLDLSDMRRVVEIDARLAYAVVEPGVSQRDLHAHLDERGVPLWIPTTGSTPDASMMGNAIERGWGHTLYGDHFSNVCGMEVVLADGTVVRTGFGRYPGSRVDHLFKAAPGPWVDGLFSQSNMGIVTRVGLWLMPRPEHFAAFIVGVEDERNFLPLIDRLRPLRLGGTLKSPVHFSNAARMISYRQRYPWEEAGGATPMSRELVERLRGRYEYGAWACTGALTGSRAEVRAAFKSVKRAVGDLGELHLVTPKILDGIEAAAGALGRLGISRAERWASRARLSRPGLDLLMGVPMESGLLSCRWRVRELRDEQALDPFSNDCGFYWVAPVCPMLGSELRRVLDIVETTLREYRLDPLLTVTLLNGRALLTTVQMCFDRTHAEESRDAEECHAVLLDRLIAAGYPPYRVATAGMSRLDPSGAAYWDLIERIKEAVDPAGIIAPGRYERRAAELV